jgi:hypothetical protein
MASVCSPHVLVACTLGVSVCIALCGCDSGDKGGPGDSPKEAPVWDVPPRAVLNCLSAPSFAHAGLDYCKERLAEWSRGRAYEKLMMAEEILPQVASTESVERAAPHQGPGNDLSRVAGEAKWCLERLLGVTLPDVRPDSSREEIQKLHDQAAQVIEAYRNGIMAAADDRPLSAEALEALRRKYRGKVVPDVHNKAWECPAVMEALLGEWPPIGRRYEDLVYITGAKGETREWGPEGGILYQIDTGEHFAVDYWFIVRDGIIRAVLRSTYS